MGITTTVGIRGIAVTHVAVHPAVEPNRHGMDVDAPVADSELWSGLLPALLLVWLRKPWSAWLLCHIVFIGGAGGDAGAVARYWPPMAATANIAQLLQASSGWRPQGQLEHP